MNIKERRYIRAINKILREELQKGNLPSSKEFVWKVNQYLEGHDISRPSLNFKPERRGSTARSKNFNEVVEYTYNDLEMIYISIIHQYNQAVKHFDKFEVEKEKLDHELNKLENELKEVILLYDGSGYLGSAYDIFTDFSKTDTLKSDAEIDVQMHHVQIPQVKNISKKIIPNASAKFEVLPGLINRAEVKNISGIPSDALNDKANRAWQQQVILDDKVSVGGYYTIDFEKTHQINSLSLAMHSIKPCHVLIQFTPDNLNWINLPYYEEGKTVENKFTFDFPMINVSKIRLLITKSEPDNEVLIQKKDEPDRIKYSYLFGIQNISFYTLGYAKKAEFYSNKLTVDAPVDRNFTIDKVSLLTEEELPNGTDIKYYVALPNSESEPEWKAISPVNRQNPQHDQVIDFKNISTSLPNVFSIDPDITIGEYELENLQANGIRFYKIGEVRGRKIIKGTDQLFAGRNTWGVKSYVYSHPNHDAHLPSIEDWQKPESQVLSSYVKIIDGKPGLLLNKESSETPTNYMFTLGAYSNKVKELATAVPASTDPIAIYMNGELLYQGIPDTSSRINYLFQQGWNEIVVLVYTRETVDTTNGSTVDLGLDPRKYASNIYAKTKPLKRVSLFDLRHNVLNNDYDKYALIETGDQTSIIINHAMPGLEYEYFYNYADGNIKNEILFKAELSRDETITELSPKIKSYRLRFS